MLQNLPLFAQFMICQPVDYVFNMFISLKLPLNDEKLICYDF